MSAKEEDRWDREPTDQDRFNLFEARPQSVTRTQEEKEAELLREEQELGQAKSLKTESEAAQGRGSTSSSLTSRNTPKPKRASKVLASVVKLLKRGGQKTQGEASGYVGEVTDEDVKAYFAAVQKDKFSEQAVKFLNAYWAQIGSQANFIYDVALKWFVYADMHTKGISDHSVYEEAQDLDYMTTLYFYEKLCYFLNNTEEGKKYRDDPVYKPSMVEMKTAIQRKRELRQKVDVNFDGRISFIEHLLYQYNCDEINVQDYVRRQRTSGKEHPSIVKACKALHAVSEQINKYLEKKEELEKLANGTSGSIILRRRAQFELSCLNAGPLAERLQAALIDAEAKVRKAVKKFSRSSARHSSGGSLYWIQRDLETQRETVEEIKTTGAA